jgi:hypothetical protein
VNLSPHEREELRARFAYSTPWWAGGMRQDQSGRWHPPGPQSFQGCARILDKRRRLVPLIARPWQLELDDKLEEQRANGEPMRALILKARQLGFSTWGMAKLTQRVTQLPYQHAVVVAHTVKTAASLFDMGKRMYAHLPNEQTLGLGFNIKPDVINLNDSMNGRKYMQFGERSRRLRHEGRDDTSLIEIDTAGAPEAGRGTTPNLLWCSEVAWWENPNKLLGLLNAVPNEPETLIVQESTANGLNDFHKAWNRAMEGAEDETVGGRYVPIFAPWWRDPTYQRAFLNEESKRRFVDSIGTGAYGADEPGLIDLYGCTPEQLYWRRTAIREQARDSIEYFKQEYPASPEEAFIGSGRTVFSGILVSRAISAVASEPEPVKGTLRPTGFLDRPTRSGLVRIPTGVVWVPEEELDRGEPVLEVWEHPVTVESQQALPERERRPEGAYVVAEDVAEGEANTFTEGDFHAIQVFDHRSRKQVAVHESRMDVHLLPLWTLLVALYYNRAWLGVEVNGPGIAVTEVLGKDFKYGRLYRRRRFDSRREVIEDRTGWKTDKATKPAIEQGFGEALQEGTHGLRHLRTVRQLNTYVTDDRGRHGATDGEHDDLLMAAMIAHRLMDELRPPKTDRKRARYVPEDDVSGY